MKIDVTKQLTLGARRTLKAFRIAMFEELSEKEFDKITVNDICQRSEYPRATFYNYFDDKLDLLQYLWSYIAKDVFERLSITSENNTLVDAFNLLLGFFHSNESLLNSIKKNNGVNSHLWHNMSGYLKHEVNKVVYQYCADNHSNQVPAKMLSRFFSDLLIGMLEWCLFDEPDIETKIADKYLISLLNGKF
jgi:AcrR family transcriptional regulator